MGSVYVPHPEGGYVRHIAPDVQMQNNGKTTSRSTATVFLHPDHVQPVETLEGLGHVPKPMDVGGKSMLPGIQVTKRWTDVQGMAMARKQGMAHGPMHPDDYVRAVQRAGGEAKKVLVPFSDKPVLGHTPYEYGGGTHFGHPIVRVH